MSIIQHINTFFCARLFGKKYVSELIDKKEKKADIVWEFLKGGINELKTEVAKHKIIPQTPRPSS